MVIADYVGAKKMLFGRMAAELPKDLYFHGLAHTEEVIEATDSLAKMEWVSDEDLFVLRTAALFQDSGFLERYSNNEFIGARIAREMLPNFGYNPDQIEKVSGIIPATQMPQKPGSKLQQILCDADLDHLGRWDFFVKGELLRLEWVKHKEFNGSLRDWYVGQLNFLREHRYFTESARRLRDEGKAKHIEEIRGLLRLARFGENL